MRCRCFIQEFFFDGVGVHPFIYIKFTRRACKSRQRTPREAGGLGRTVLRTVRGGGLRKESAVVPCRCHRASDFPIVFSTFLAFHIVPEMAPLQATRVDDRKRDLTTGRTGRTGRIVQLL